MKKKIKYRESLNMRSEKEIKEKLDKLEFGESQMLNEKYFGMGYGDGCITALKWILREESELE